VRKLAVVREQVSVRKNVVRERQEIPVELGREVLRVESTGEAVVREETAETGGNG
jgi:stress response protein YsnF